MTHCLNLNSEINQAAIAKARENMTPMRRIIGIAPVEMTAEDGAKCVFNMRVIERDPTDKEKAAVKRLLPYAARKTFVAELLVNGYNTAYSQVNMAALMRYAGGEPENSTYLDDIITFLGVIGRGVETHEIIGQDAMDEVLASMPWYHCSECDFDMGRRSLTIDSDGNRLCPSCGHGVECTRA